MLEMQHLSNSCLDNSSLTLALKKELNWNICVQKRVSYILVRITSLFMMITFPLDFCCLCPFWPPLIYFFLLHPHLSILPALRSLWSSHHPCHSQTQCHCLFQKQDSPLSGRVHPTSYSVLSYIFLLPSLHSRGRMEGWFKGGGSRGKGAVKDREIGRERAKERADVWKSERAWEPLHCSFFQSVSSVDCPYQTDWRRRRLSVWPLICLNNTILQHDKHFITIHCFQLRFVFSFFLFVRPI